MQLQAIPGVDLFPGLNINSQRGFGEVDMRLPVSSSSGSWVGEDK
jgi:hypothetical protein